MKVMVVGGDNGGKVNGRLDDGEDIVTWWEGCGGIEVKLSKNVHYILT